MAGGGQLRVDYENLSALDGRLSRILTTMTNDSSHMSSLADAVGDARLASKLNDFGSSWRIHREQIHENIEWLRDSVRQIHTELANTDAELANGLQGGASATGHGPVAV